MAIESPTVLCIDDRPQVLNLRKATLKAYGYYVKVRIERLHSDKDGFVLTRLEKPPYPFAR